MNKDVLRYLDKVERYINYVVDRIMGYITIDYNKKVILYSNLTANPMVIQIPFYLLEDYDFNSVGWFNKWLESTYGVDKKNRSKVYNHLKKKIMGEVLSVSK